MAYIEECLEKFSLLPTEVQDILGNAAALEKIGYIEKKFGVELKFLVVLVAIAELKIEDMAQYLMARDKLSEPQARRISNYLLYSVFMPLVRFYQEEELGETYDKEVREIFSSGLLPFLKEPAEEQVMVLNEKINYVLLYKGFEFIDKLIDILTKNQERVSAQQFSMNKKMTDSTLGNWLQHFIFTIRDKELNALVVSEFMTTNGNLKLLLPEEKQIIFRLLRLYQSLKLFPEGLAVSVTGAWNIFPWDLEVGEEKKIVSKPVEVLIKKEGVDCLTDNLLRSYNLRSIKWTTVEKRLSKLTEIYTQLHKFQKQFHQAINSRSKEDIVAGLMVLASQGHLDEIFERDAKIKEIYKAHLAKKFSDKLAQDMEDNLRAPVYLSYFLQHLLKDILKLNENESAVLAIKLVNELKRAGDKQYLAIAYGDLASGRFKWKTIVEKEDRLELGNS